MREGEVFFTGGRYFMHGSVFFRTGDCMDINMLNNPRPHRIRFVVFVR